MSSERADILGCPVDCLSFADAIDELTRRIRDRQVTHVVFSNVAKIVRMRKDAALARALRSAELVLADGVPLTWVAPLLGSALAGRVNGTDLFEGMVAEAARHGFRVYFLGATDEVVQATVAQFKRRHPDLIIAGCRSGYFNDVEESEIVEQIAESDADILFLGMGTPKKELWGARNLHKLNVSVCQGVGGSFDVIAGALKRAPRWMQRAGLEWFYRIVQEPGRMWKRYLLTNTAFCWQLLIELLRRAVRPRTIAGGAHEKRGATGRRKAA